MLKEFRSIDVYWDKATRRIYEEIRSSSSDEKGRKLTVQIVNDGQIQDLTNVALNLYWETQDGESRGLDPFEPLDAENGIYELYFRTGMLQHVGKLNAHLHLVDTTGAITSEPFTIVVFEGVDVDAMASDDELSALTQALVQVNNLETTYAPRLNSIEGSVDSLTDDAALLDGRLTTVEQNIDEHLAENASESKAGHIKLPEPWTDLTLQNGWVAAGNVRVFKDPFGIVYLEILASGGTSTSGTVITNLHSKFCPTEIVTFRIDSGAMTISTDGRVRFSGNHSIAGLLIINIVFRGAV